MSSFNLLSTMTSKSTVREKLLTVRATEQVHADFKVVAELKGLSMSALVHSVVVNAIREEKARDLATFNEVRERQRNEAEERTKAKTTDRSNGAPKVLRLKRPNKKLTKRGHAKRKLSG